MRSRFVASLSVALFLFASGSALVSARAGDRRDYKSYAKEINGVGSWLESRGTRRPDRCKFDLEASKSGGDWTLHVKKFLPSVDEIYFDSCEDEKDPKSIQCVKIDEVYSENGEKGCAIERMTYRRGDGLKAQIRFEKLLLSDIRDSKRRKVLFARIGKKVEYTCEDAYSAMGPGDAEVQDSRDCYGN